jgi:hypothetical protein
MMRTQGSLALIYPAEEQDAARLIQQAIDRSVTLMREHWELDAPADCRVYIMTSWPGFLFESAPLAWKIALAATLPLWIRRVKRLWAISGGWELSYGRRRIVGVKAPRLLQIEHGGIGDRIFVKESSSDEKVQRITCHELAHAFTSHLRLPPWLKEGLAMVAVDRLCEKPTVRPETLSFGSSSTTGRVHARGGRRMATDDEDSLVALYTHGYWVTRYLEETRPGLLTSLLSQRRKGGEWDAAVATAYGQNAADFWSGIDADLASHFVR